MPKARDLRHEAAKRGGSGYKQQHRFRRFPEQASSSNFDRASEWDGNEFRVDRISIDLLSLAACIVDRRSLVLCFFSIMGLSLSCRVSSRPVRTLDLADLDVCANFRNLGILGEFHTWRYLMVNHSPNGRSIFDERDV